MNDIAIGIRFRALRQRLGWRQVDLAARAGVSQDVISLVERGRLEDVTLRKLRRIARELDAELLNLLRWRGGDLDRLVDEGHAALAGRVARLLEADEWQVRFEVSYSVYGERGSIDIAAWHPATRTLLVVEVKTELVAIEETLRKHDAKVRLAPAIARERFGWTPAAVGRLLVLPSASTPRRRVDRHAAVMDNAYPLRGAGLRGWLRNPGGPAAGLLFVEIEAAKGPRPIASRRVRRAGDTQAEMTTA